MDYESFVRPSFRGRGTLIIVHDVHLALGAEGLRLLFALGKSSSRHSALEVKDASAAPDGARLLSRWLVCVHAVRRVLLRCQNV